MKKIFVLPIFATLLIVLIVLPSDASAAPSMSVTPEHASPGQTVVVTGTGFSSSDLSATIQGGNGAIFIPTSNAPCLVDNGQLVTVVSGKEIFSCSFFAFPSHNGAQAGQELRAVGNTGDYAFDDSFSISSGIAAYPSQGSIGTVVTLYGSGYIGDIIIKNFPVGDQDLKVYFDNYLVAEGLQSYFQKLTPGSTSTCYPSQGSLDDSGQCTFSVPILDPGTYTIAAKAYSFGLQTESYSTTFTILGPSISVSNQEATKSSTITVTGTNFSGTDTSGKILWRGADITPSSGCPFTTSTTGSSFSCTIQVPSSNLASPGPNSITVVGTQYGDSASTSVDIPGPYPLSLSSSQTLVGSTITVSGNSFDPSDTLVFLNMGQPGNSGPTCPLTNGAFSCSFIVPINAATGNTAIYAQGNNAADYDFANLDITGGIALSTSSGTVGTAVTISGNGFSHQGNPDDSVTATFDGQSIPITVTNTADIIGKINGNPVYYTYTGSCPTQNSDGSLPAPSYTCSFIIPPSAVAGTNTLTLTGNGGDSVSTTFTLISSISLSKTQGSIGSPIAVEGFGFPTTARYVQFEINNNVVSPTCLSSPTGFLSCDFIVPPLPPGSYTVDALGSVTPPTLFNTGQFVTSTSFTTVPSLTLSAPEGPQGSTVNFQANGFSPADTGITLFLNSTSLTPSGCTQSSSSTSSFSCGFTVPNISPNNNYLIKVVGNSNGDSASASFTVSGISISPQFGRASTNIDVKGYGFAQDTSATFTIGGSPPSVTFDPKVGGNGCPVSAGFFECIIQVPDVSGGNQEIVATGSSGDTVTTTFTHTPEIFIYKPFSPQGQPGTSIQLEGDGFLISDTSVTVEFNGQTVASCPVSGGSFFCQSLFDVPSISPGSYYIDATGSSGVSGDVGITSFVVTSPSDTIPPTLAVTSPGNNTETNSNTVTVSGMASDDTSVSSVTWNLDSGLVSTATGTTSWSFNTGTIPDGFHLIQINTTDSAGLVTEQHLGITVDTTPPVIAPISDQTVEATSSAGAVATFTATATDNIDGTDPVTCIPSSSSTFPLGSTLVTCNSQDAAGNAATPVTFTITVQDTTQPILTLPSDITQEATGPSGNTVTYTASANDLVNGPITPICTLASGSTFPVGTTPVTCTATDAHHNTASGTFHMIIQDTTPPSITVTDINAKATGTLTPVTFSPTATDIVDGTDPVICTSTSGSTFPLGTSTVNCSSTDAHHNIATASFTVTVAETTAPSITLPADIVQEAIGPAGNVVTFSATTTDIVDVTDPVSCTPASGSTFALGSTLVTCTSSNNAGNTATGAFHVVIQDTIPPTLTIQSPANNAIVNTATVPVSGTASDNVRVASVSWKADSGPVSIASGTTSWSFTTNTLSTGLHTIYVNATDEAGNVTKSSVSIAYVESTATLPPPSGGTTPITFSSSTGGFSDLNSIIPSSISPPPPPGNYPLGFFSWSITGFGSASSVTVTIISPTTLYLQSHYFILVNGNWVSIPVTVHGNTMAMTIPNQGPFDGNSHLGIISDLGAIVNPTDGRVTGDGTIGKNIDFTFEARSNIGKTDNTQGTIDFHDKSGNIKLHSNRVSILSVDNTVSQATFSGTGDIGNKHNYIFIVSIADPDKTGNHDTFSITVTDNTGKVVYTNSGTVKGHIEIHKFADRDDKSDSGSKYGNNDHNNKNSK